MPLPYRTCNETDTLYFWIGDHIEFPQLKPIIVSLVDKLHDGTIKNEFIYHIPYRAVIDAVGGKSSFSTIALNAVDSRILALQGQTITRNK